MSGTDRIRHCGEYGLNVYNLSGMSQAEVDALLKEKEGRICVRFFRRADDGLMTTDCPIAEIDSSRTIVLGGASVASISPRRRRGLALRRRSERSRHRSDATEFGGHDR